MVGMRRSLTGMLVRYGSLAGGTQTFAPTLRVKVKPPLLITPPTEGAEDSSPVGVEDEDFQLAATLPCLCELQLHAAAHINKINRTISALAETTAVKAQIPQSSK
jgi:hypothetical protein